ncbi:MAG: fibronectin type III domain-containing protein, partial [Bacteroidales bacterium]|nr:fibronectin type III domain-containing protein [Bacteroidales bacterium]
MQKFLRNLTLVALMVLPWVASAQNTLTVADGTATNAYVPVYGLYADAYLHSQIIYPAADIAAAVNTVDMNGGSITGLTFYTSQASVSLTATFEVKMMETTATTLSSFADVSSATTVYTGTVSIDNNEMIITFTSPYTYNGGNLLVDFSSTSTGNWSTTTYYGVSASGASVQGYSYSDVASVSATARDFIPKTTFTFTGGTPVTCPAVQSYGLGTIDSNSAVITWVDALNSGASYTVTYWADGDASNPLTETSSGDSATLTGLNANTVYHYTVQVNCSASENSVALGGTFRTACGTMSLPLFVDFEDAAYNGAWYPCWDSTIHAGTDPSVNDQPGGSYNPTQHTPGGTYAMYLQGNSSENYNLVVGPSMDVSGDNIYCRFWAFVNSGWIKAGVISNPSDTSTFIPLVQVSGSSWAEYEFNTANLSSTANYRVAWLAYGTQYIGKFDDVYISEIPSCLRVSSVAIDSVSDESITVSWVDTLNSGATYTVTCYGPNDTVEQSNVTDLFYVFDNLNANTPYTFSVVVNCGSGDAEAVTVSARTACAAMQIPFTEGFEDAGALSCWKMVDCVSSTGRTTGNANTGNACFRFYYGYNNQYLISPELTGTDNGVKVQFAYKQGTSYTETFKVGYSTTNDSVSSFVWGDEMTATSSYQTFSGIYPAGTKYVSIQLTSYDQLYLYIDDINFAEPPACMPVSLMGVDTVTADAATIYWTAPDGQSDFFVLLDSTVYTTSDTFYTFTGLDARTAYTAYVASDCSGDTSEWRNVSFTTDCAGGSCNITVAMVDSYGDGWNGAKLSFTQNGAVAGEATLGSGSSATATISVCSGTPVNYSWQTGSYDSECSYVIYDGSGAEVYNSATSGVNHSDVILDPCPTCLLPVGVMASAIDSNELTFVWTEDVNVDHYIVSFNGGGYTLPNNGNASHMVTGLTPNTAYTFSVIAVCDPYVDSSVARTITVKTACGEMLLPVVEGFESDNDGSVPSCWNVVSGSPAVTTSSYYAHTGNNSLALEGGDMIATSQVPLDGDSIYVSFWADVYSGTLQAGVMTNPLYDSTFVPLLTVTSTNGYEMFEFNTATMDHYTNYYVAFRFNGGSYYGINIDDINIRKNEGCMYPANLTATPAAHSVDLTWVNNSSNNDFVVQYRAASATAWDTTVAVNDTTYTVNGLNAASNYVFRVGYLCN